MLILLEAPVTTLYVGIPMPSAVYRGKLKWNEAYSQEPVATWMRINTERF
jgi:hypothetical protein